MANSICAWFCCFLGAAAGAMAAEVDEDEGFFRRRKRWTAIKYETNIRATVT